MQKKLLTAAVAAALASPAFVAQADVTVYGIAQVEWATVQNDSLYLVFGNPATGGGSWNDAAVGIDSTRSALLDNKMGRFGIKASEDIGGGWSGIAQFEFQTDTADNQDGNNGANTPITSRSSFVGLSHKSVGTLRFGRDASPYAATVGAMDPFVATALEARNNYGMSGNRDGWGVANAHGSFWSDSMFFNSASFGGAYVNLALGLNRTGTDVGCLTGLGNNCDVGANNAKNNGDLSVLAGWKGDVGVGLNVFGGYTKMANANTNGTGDEPTAMKLGAQVTVAKAHTISLQYETTDRASYAGTPFDSYDDATYLFLGYQGKFGPVTAVAQFGMFEGGDLLGLIDYEAQYLAVGALYDFTKTFKAFGGVRKTTLDINYLGTGYALRDETVLSLGLRKSF